MDTGESRQLALPGLGEAETSWSLRRSPRARRVSVRVFHSGRVEVIAPLRASERRVSDFLLRHRQWIERKSFEGRQRAATSNAAFPPSELRLPAFGEHWRLHWAGGLGLPRVTVGGDGLLRVSGDIADRQRLRRALLGWLTERSRGQLETSLAAVAHDFGFRYGRVQMRLQRTRWGSCSARGTISLNVCLAFQRPEVVHYLLVHELAHTRHMNHSARFWDCVAQLCPRWRTLDRELLDGWRQVPYWVFP